MHAAVIGWATAIVDPEAIRRAIVAPGQTLAEALALTDLDLSRPTLVKMGDAFYFRDEWASVIVEPGARIAAMAMPQGKQTSRVVAMLAIVIAATIFLGPETGAAIWLANATGLSAATASAIAITVATTAGSALINTILPPSSPKVPGKQGETSPTYSLNGQGNYARLGEAVPEQLGTHIHFLDLVAGYKEFIGDQELLLTGYSLGEGEFEIHEWGYDKTPAWRGPQWNLVGRHEFITLTDSVIQTSATPVGLSDWEITMTGDGSTAVATASARAWTTGQTHTVSFIAWVDGATSVTLSNDLFPDTLPQQNFTLSATPQVYTWSFSSTHADMAVGRFRFFSPSLATGRVIHIKDVQVVRRSYAPPFRDKLPGWVEGFTDSFNSIGFQVVPPGDAPSLFSDAVSPSGDVSGQTLRATNEPGATWIGPFPCSPPGTRPISYGFDLFWGRGLFTAEDDGSYSDSSVTVEIQLQEIDDVGLAIGSWTTVISETFTDRRGPRLKRATLRVDSPDSAKRYQARNRRSDARIDDNANIDETSWAGMKAYYPPTTDIGSESWMMVRAVANEQLQGQAASKLYVIKTRLLPVLDDGDWTAPRPTRSIAAAIGHVHRSVWPDGELDVDSLEQLDQTWALRGDTCDGIFDASRSAWDVLQTIALCGRARPILPKGTLSIIRDEPRSIRTVSLSPGNMLPGAASVDYVLANADLADRLIVEYLDERTWRPATVECVLPGVTPVNTKRIKTILMVRRQQVWREHMFKLAENAWRRIFATTETEMEGLLLWPGHKVLFGHDAVNWGEHARVAAFDGVRVSMDRPLEWKTGETHMLALARRNGQVWGPVAVTRESDTTCLLPDPLPGGLPHPSTVCVSKASSGGKIEPSVAQFGWAGRFARDMLVMSARPRAGGKTQVALVIDDPRVHTADAGLAPAPPAAPADPGNEDLALSFSISVTGSGDLRTVAITMTWGADVKLAEYEIGGLPYGLTPSLSWSKIVPAAGASSVRIRAYGAWSMGGWVNPT